MSEEAKVRFLFKKVEHSGLRSSIDALKALETMGQVITYTMAVNHLVTAVSELPEVLAKSGRNISGVSQTGGKGNGQCPACGGWGALYNLCQDCKDSGMIYDSLG